MKGLSMCEGNVCVDDDGATVSELCRLGTIENAIAGGLSQVAGHFVKKYRFALASSPSLLVRERWQYLEVLLYAIDAVEKDFGVGALLDLEHPAVCRLLNVTKDDGTPAISAEMLLASEKYNKLRSNG